MSNHKRHVAGINLAILLLAIVPAGAKADEPAGILAEGQALFERQFEAGIAAAEGGDGLGPVFNHHSCAACHQQGGVGGGGPIDVNAVTLTAALASPTTRPDRKKIVEALERVHPGFVSDKQEITPSIALHRFGTDAKYESLRVALGGPAVPRDPTPRQRDQLQRRLARVPLAAAEGPKLLSLKLSQRNTPALFGAGLIDQITDHELLVLAAAQKEHGEVSGRVARGGRGKIGRFGWRGQTERLHDFVIGACANELGLEVPGSPQPMDPLRPKYRPAGLDLTAAQCALLTAFVASLPPPKFIAPNEPDRGEIVARGRILFRSVGCSACHVEQVSRIEGLYSDLLLHDMGHVLADPVSAETVSAASAERAPSKGNSAEQTVSSEPQPPRRRGYSGGSSNFFGPQGEEQQEWRTPPLWGVADSAPYLHDGRAATLVEAIAMHGGEAEPCTQRYFALGVGERMAVLEFLGCLRAPQP